jgi:hypothetical protein
MDADQSAAEQLGSDDERDAVDRAYARLCDYWASTVSGGRRATARPPGSS